MPLLCQKCDAFALTKADPIELGLRCTECGKNTPAKIFPLFIVTGASGSGKTTNDWSVDASGGGPSLLPELTSVLEGFVDNANRRDALGSTQPNARTAMGITSGSIPIFF